MASTHLQSLILQTPEDDVTDLTTVELLWLEKRIENRIRFGRAVAERIIDRRRRILSFAPRSEERRVGKECSS